MAKSINKKPAEWRLMISQEAFLLFMPPDGFEPSTNCIKGKKISSGAKGVRDHDRVFESRGRPEMFSKWTKLETFRVVSPVLFQHQPAAS